MLRCQEVKEENAKIYLLLTQNGYLDINSYIEKSSLGPCFFRTYSLIVLMLFSKKSFLDILYRSSELKPCCADARDLHVCCEGVEGSVSHCLAYIPL